MRTIAAANSTRAAALVLAGMGALGTGGSAAAAPVAQTALRPRAGATSAAPPLFRSVAGKVIARTSRWSRDGRSILTRAVIRAPDGSKEVVWQLGGTVNGIGMKVFDSPPLLRVGEQVRISARRTTTANGQVAWQLAALAAPVLTRQRRRGDVNVPAGTGDGAGAVPFVHTVTSHGTPVHWASGCVFMTYDARGTTEVPGNTEFDVMDKVLNTWHQATASCSYISLKSTTPQLGEVGNDGVNLVIFREKEWCRPAVGSDPKMCYDPASAAITTLSYVDDPNSARDGEILDADVEINAHDFAVSVNGQTNSPIQCHAELANTFTHEMGHVMGLDHTCYIGTGPHLNDNTGAPVPSCYSNNLPPQITESTMYNFQACGETKKESPEQDDIDGVCSIYPSAQSPGTCARPAPLLKTGCAVAAAGAGARAAGRSGWACWLLAAMALAAYRWARRRG